MPLYHQDKAYTLSVGSHPVHEKGPRDKNQDNVHVPECLKWDTDTKPELYRYVREVDPKTGKEVVRKERYHPRPFNRPAELGKPRQFVPEDQRSEFSYKSRREESSVAEAMRWWPDINKDQNQSGESQSNGHDKDKNDQHGNKNGGHGSNRVHHPHRARSSSSSSCSCSSSTSSENLNHRSRHEHRHHQQSNPSKQLDEQKSTRGNTKQQQHHYDKSNKNRSRHTIRDTKSNILRTEYITNVKTPTEIHYDESALKDIQNKRQSKGKRKVKKNQERNNIESDLKNEQMHSKERDEERAYFIDNRPINPMVGDYYRMY